ncbi:class I SAM-dependent methyltransferase [Alloscardovia omnicolens]|uniref:class I SAM-dependent methyltransferase n=1 Tax=Alloscardovia omnicolens TaxID=419015 RepID=UPI00254E1B41|nr:class I SAM-dependent methyltransferase [Alloscardovia omnicolens]MDK8074131.1 class I SAM-dependent methyltransferase [Alloscardovia omnicolens]
MKQKENRDNKSFWNRIAKLYTRIQEKGNKQLYETLIKKIEAHLSDEQSVLELGCGTGQLSLPLAPKAKTWLATDFSKCMIAEAKKREKSSNLCFCVEDATALSFDSNRFDVVLIANTLHIMPKPKKALEEIHRVLKTDGLLIVPTFVAEEKIHRLKLWLMKRIGFRVFHSWKLAEFKAFICQNGFELLQCELLPTSPWPECFLVARKINGTVGKGSDFKEV